MRLKSFTAASVPEALKLVRDHLGPDAVVLSTQEYEANGQVRVTAAIEEPPRGDSPSGRPPPHDTLTHLRPIEDLSESLCFHRVPVDLADRLLSAAGRPRGAGPPGSLSAALAEEFAFAEPPGGAGRPTMLVGPPGAGKTATAAKLCALARLAGRRGRLITMDTVKAGAMSQIDTYAEALGVALDAASDDDGLLRLVANAADAGGDGPVLIDTVGCSPLDRDEHRRLAATADAAGARMVAVLAAGGDVLEMAEGAAALAEAGATGLIVTKLDTTRRLGGILSAASAGPLSLMAAGVAPGIGDGLVRLDPAALARFLLDGAATPAEHGPAAMGAFG
jgi:flagellar biosynthesis protein FlhF